MLPVPSQYPDWLDTNKASLSADEYQRYEQQAKIMGDICNQFEREEEGANKDGTFESILELMQQVRQRFYLSSCESIVKKL